MNRKNYFIFKGFLLVCGFSCLGKTFNLYGGDSTGSERAIGTRKTTVFIGGETNEEKKYLGKRGAHKGNNIDYFDGNPQETLSGGAVAGGGEGEDEDVYEDAVEDLGEGRGEGEGGGGEGGGQGQGEGEDGGEGGGQGGGEGGGQGGYCAIM
ncbi:MAG: hypothetical protein ACRC12_04475 [Holosporales bacterium]